MPALNFQKRFAALVESGEKRQTIRKYRRDKRDPRRGDRLYLYTGQRTRACRKLGEATCLSVEPVEISEIGICVGNDLPPCDERDKIAVADGFRNEWELIECIKSMHGLPFEGLLIRW